ncbi:tricalbin-1-like [Acropora millepora]|uniref:tricalbin-1-like n=1 Tax=Acropora millepora TaxID=45264 RepID=UPI001CF5D0B5|nr:tricalbin-1-like [Acropora millepora]
MADNIPDPVEAREKKERDETQLRLSIFVCGVIILSWFLGAYGFSLVWAGFIIPLIFTVWYRKNCRILDGRVREAEIKVHRRKALRDEETAEWLNFVLNRWWNFSEVALCNLVRSSLNPVLEYSKPSFIESMELTEFSFGKKTPFLKYVKVFENVDEEDSPDIPASEANAFKPPVDMATRQRHLLVLVMDLCLHAPDTKIAIRVRLGGKMVGADVDVSIEDVSLSGRIQIVFEMDHLVPFPHMKSVAVTFLEKPDVDFDVRLMRAVQVMDIPMLKDFINALVMDSLTYALVDPGRIEVPLHEVDPDEMLSAAKKSTYADGILTVTLKGGMQEKFTDDYVWTSLQVGNLDEKNTEKILGGTTFEESISLLIYDLASDKLNVEVRGKRSFGTKYAIAKYKMFLGSLGLQKKKKVETTLSKEGIRGSKLEVTLEYSPLKTYEVSSRTDEQEFLEKYVKPTEESPVSGLLLVVVHSGERLFAMDDDGFSDPYCIVAANNEKIRTTPHVSESVNPVWESVVEFMVKDFTKTTLSFLVYDRDSNWQGQSDDFMGSCNLQMTLDEPAVIKRNIDLNYKVFGKKRSEDTVMKAGSLTVSVVFQPVESVGKSEKDVQPGGVPDGDDIDEINEHSKKHTMKSSMKIKRQVEEMKLIKELGVLVISLLQGKDMAAMDSNGLSDPFCVVRVNNEKKYKTNVAYETLKPIWNESVSIAMPQADDKINIDVFDKDVFQNDFMGTVSLTVDEIKESSKKGGPQWYKLQEAESGEIQLHFKVSIPGEQDEAEKAGEATLPTGENGNDSGISDAGETAEPAKDVFDLTLDKMDEYIESQIPPLFYSVSGEIIQGSDISGWGTFQIRACVHIPRRGRKGSVKHEKISMCTTPQLTPESGMAKWNYVFQTSGGTAIPNEANLMFELRDAKKKTAGKVKMSISEFFKDSFTKRARSATGSSAGGKYSETKWLNLEHDGMPVGRLQVMLSYSDTPDAPMAPTTVRKRSLLKKKFSSSSNL